MNIHEYQAKQLLAQYGVPLAPGDVCDTPEAAKAIAEKLFGNGANTVVIKAQVHAGGRGKAGGVKFVRSKEELAEITKKLF